MKLDSNLAGLSAKKFHLESRWIPYFHMDSMWKYQKSMEGKFLKISNRFISNNPRNCNLFINNIQA